MQIGLLAYRAVDKAVADQLQRLIKQVRADDRQFEALVLANEAGDCGIWAAERHQGGEIRMRPQNVPHGPELARHVGWIGVVNPDVAHAPFCHALPRALDAQVER